MTILSSWLTEYRCVSCKRRVSYHTVMYSLGRCPRCGHKGEDACTIMDTTEHAYRVVRDGAWWQIWKATRRVYADEAASPPS